MKKPILLTIIDGLGISEKIEGNAWLQADTPFLDKLMKEYPNTFLEAAGKSVGLPEGQIGNSEVGHLNIGAGEIVYTGLSLIQRAIDENTFSTTPAFIKAFKHSKENGTTLHLVGLLSKGGVHSNEEHLFALIEAVHAFGIKDVTLHIFTDGRDVPPKSCEDSIKKTIQILEKYNYKIGSISGRLYSMDRDSIFERTEKAYLAIAGKGGNQFNSPISYIESQYEKKLTDEFIEPAFNSDINVKFLNHNDAIVFFNFRPDRTRQLAHLFVGSEIYKDITPSYEIKDLFLTTMMKYEGINNCEVAFDKQDVENPIGKVLSEQNLTQLRIAETQKYAHVTFFMDGGKETPYKNADRILVNSLKIENFADKPEMSAKGITDELLKVMNKYDVIIINYANPDMVGHTGDMNATKKAIEILDSELSRLYNETVKIGGTMFITADHGNAEEMLTSNGNVITAHSSNNVPLIVTDKNITLNNGVLTDIAPTILNYLNLPIPETMTGKNLIVNKK